MTRPTFSQYSLNEKQSSHTDTTTGIEGLINRGGCPLLTVIIPVFNEAPTLSDVLRRVSGLAISKEIIVVNDGSTDASGQLLNEWIGVSGVHVFSHRLNQGKGAAIRTALQFAIGQYVIVQDGDLETDPKEIPKLIEPLIRGEADIVVGNRFAQHQQHIFTRRYLMRMGVNILNHVVRLIYGQRLSDEACCYKVLTTANLRAMDLVYCSG